MSKKISSFIVDDNISDAALITYVENGQNKTISQAAYKSKFGTTGSMEQAGALSSTAILQKDGTVNKIRSVEAGPGMVPSLSPENGLVLSLNLNQEPTGHPIITDLNLMTPKIASIVAGAGITITQVDGVITISLS
jgi:hypothetical protein